MRNDSPSVTTTMLWCKRRSRRLTAVVCSGRIHPHWEGPVRRDGERASVVGGGDEAEQQI